MQTRIRWVYNYPMSKSFLRIDRLMAMALLAPFALLPLLFFPYTEDLYIPIKMTTLVGSALVVLFFWSITVWRSGTIRVSLSKGMYGTLILAIVGMISLFVSSTSRIDGLTNPMGALSWISWTILLIFGSAYLTTGVRSILSWILLAVSTIVSLLSIASHFQLPSLIFPSLSYLASRSFTPLGTITAIPWFVIGSIPIALTLSSSAWKKRNMTAMAMVILAAGILATSVSLYTLLPGGDRVSLPFANAWIITFESFKLPIHALVGSGAENFVSAFALGRTPGLNTTPLWNLRFAYSSSLILHIATIYGLAGLLGLIFLAKAWFNRSQTILEWIDTAASVTVLLFAPPILPMVALFIGTYLVIHNKNNQSISINISKHHSWLRFAMPFFCALLWLMSFYFIARAFQSELTFFQSLKARQVGDGRRTYNLQNDAITLNPSALRYRIAYSQTNIDLANAIAHESREDTDKSNQANVQKVLTDNDRQTITALIQQAIREAKIAVALSPDSPIAWENLARIYQNLINVAQGADQWAIASYNRVLTLDPTNPILRLLYGSVLKNQGDLDTSLIHLQVATRLKPDYTIAFLLLASIYHDRKQYFFESRSLAQALRYLPKDSPDTTKIRENLKTAKALLTQNELTQIDQLDKEASESPGSSLTSPLPDNTLKTIEPKLSISDESSGSAQ